MGRAFLTGGHARACVNLLRLMESVEQFLFTGFGHIGEDRQEGRLHDEAFRLLRSLLAQDQPARRGLGRGADADLLEGGRVQHRAMIGGVDQHHRIVGKMRIQIIARDLALVRKIGDVIAIGDDPFAGLGLEFFRVRLERLDDVGDGRHRPRRHAGDIGPFHDLRRIHEMAVRIDEGGQQRRALEIDDLRLLALSRHHRRLVADGDDAAAGDRHGFNLRAFVDHGQDHAAAKDFVREALPCLVGGLFSLAPLGESRARSQRRSPRSDNQPPSVHAARHEELPFGLTRTIAGEIRARRGRF